MKILMESKRFDHIDMRYLAFKNWSGIPIETKELEIHHVPFGKILRSGFIKANSLSIKYSNESFDDNLFNVNIR